MKNIKKPDFPVQIVPEVKKNLIVKVLYFVYLTTFDSPMFLQTDIIYGYGFD